MRCKKLPVRREPCVLRGDHVPCAWDVELLAVFVGEHLPAVDVLLARDLAEAGASSSGSVLECADHVALKAGEAVGLKGKARGFKTILLAAPTTEELERLVRTTEMLK